MSRSLDIYGCTEAADFDKNNNRNAIREGVPSFASFASLSHSLQFLYWFHSRSCQLIDCETLRSSLTLSRFDPSNRKWFYVNENVGNVLRLLLFTRWIIV